MATHVIVDHINRATMRSVVHEYRFSDELETHERAALALVSDRMRDRRILDIGVGAGRTVRELRQVSENYIGVDYVQEMVDHCRHRFPGVHFERADARAMPQFDDESFDLIVFACNGIAMVDHAGRLSILREVYRLLAPGGVFIFSTNNRNNPGHDKLLALPTLQPTLAPHRLLVRGLRFAGQTAFRVFNRLRYRRHEIRTADYAILNDRCHHYRTMLYFITMENQRRQLETIGFRSDPIVIDLSGRVVSGDTSDGTMTFVTTK
jgi:SAM-dependent methyltransferase